MKQKLIAIFLLVIGPILLVGGFMKEATLRKIESKGVSGAVTIKEKVERRGKRGKVTYQFVMKPMTVFGPERTFEVSRKMYDSMPEGAPAPIKYLKGDLDGYILLGTEDDSGMAILIGFIVTGIGAVATWWFVFRARKSEDAMEPVLD